MLVFLSSGARIRYREDIARSLALPQGGELQFRYDLEIVDDKFIAAVNANSVNFADALICYIWNGTKGGPIDFVPCRLANIKQAEIVGTSLIVKFIVQGFANFAPVEQFSDTLRNTVGDRLPTWIRGSEGYKLQGYFVIDAADSLAIVGYSSIKTFESIVRELCKFADFATQDKRGFYTVLGINEVWTRFGYQYFTPVEKSNNKYLLKSGAAYELNVYVYSPEQGTSTNTQKLRLNITSDFKTLDFPLGKVTNIDSEYDVKKVQFSVDSQPFSSIASVVIYVDDPNVAESMLNDIQIPLKFNGNLLSSLVKAALLTIGVAGPAMISAYAADKLGFGNALLMIFVALAAGATSVFYPSRK